LSCRNSVAVSGVTMPSPGAASRFASRQRAMRRALFVLLERLAGTSWRKRALDLTIVAFSLGKGATFPGKSAVERNLPFSPRRPVITRVGDDVRVPRGDGSAANTGDTCCHRNRVGVGGG